MPQGYFDQLEMAVTHDRQIELVVAEYDRIIRHREASGCYLRGRLQVGVHPGIERAVLIRQIDLNQHRARRLIEGIGMAGDGARKTAIRELGDSYAGRIAILDEWREALRHVRVDSERC